jgi:hypothetical protein
VSNRIVFTRVKNDTYGNPRYVCHFLNLDVHGTESGIDLSDRYRLACDLARRIGGRKFHNKQFGGGVVFQSYSLDSTLAAINRVTGRDYAEAVIF